MIKRSTRAKLNAGEVAGHQGEEELHSLSIGEAAERSGVSAKLIRHYESIGLIPKAARLSSGYRSYNHHDVHTLRFIKRARGLGFSIKEIKKLLSLWKNKSRASKDVKSLVLTHLQEVEEKIMELQELAETLRHLSRNCHGDHRPDCPILQGLEASAGAGQ